MALIATASAPTTCEANTIQVGITEWGTAPTACQVRTGLRSFLDRAGHRRHYCGSQGHESNVKRRFGVAMFEGMD